MSDVSTSNSNAVRFLFIAVKYSNTVLLTLNSFLSNTGV